MEALKDGIHLLNDNINGLKIAMYAMSGAQMMSSMGGLKGLSSMFTSLRASSGKLLTNMRGISSTAATPIGAASKLSSKQIAAGFGGKAAKDALAKGAGTASRGMGMGARMGAGIGLGVAGMGMQYGRSKMANPDSALGKGLGIGGSALTGAGIGMMFGPWGAAIGGLIGAGYGAYQELSKKEESKIKLNDFVLETNPNDKIGGVLDNRSVDEMKASLQQLVELQTATVKNTGEVKMEMHSYELQ